MMTARDVSSDATVPVVLRAGTSCAPQVQQLCGVPTSWTTYALQAASAYAPSGSRTIDASTAFLGVTSRCAG
jgi:hypothetical protein